jgi:hypothetical protein
MKIVTTNRDINVEYETLFIQVASVSCYDTVPSSLYVQIDCLDNQGESVFQVMGQTVTVGDAIIPYAVMKMMENLLGFVSRLPIQPKKEIILGIANPETFLMLTAQASMPNSTLDRRRKYFRARVHRMSVPVMLKLIDPELNVHYRRHVFERREDSNTYTPSWEELGVTSSEEFKREIAKRERLWITKR